MTVSIHLILTSKNLLKHEHKHENSLNFMHYSDYVVSYKICTLSPVMLLVILLDRLQKQIYMTVGPSLAASLETLAHHRNVVSLSLFYSYYFDRCSSELLAQLVPLPYSRGRSTPYSDRLDYFFVTFPRCYKDV